MAIHALTYRSQRVAPPPTPATRFPKPVGPLPTPANTNRPPRPNRALSKLAAKARLRGPSVGPFGFALVAGEVVAPLLLPEGDAPPFAMIGTGEMVLDMSGWTLVAGWSPLSGETQREVQWTYNNLAYYTVTANDGWQRDLPGGLTGVPSSITKLRIWSMRPAPSPWSPPKHTYATYQCYDRLPGGAAPSYVPDVSPVPFEAFGVPGRIVHPDPHALPAVEPVVLRNLAIDVVGNTVKLTPNVPATNPNSGTRGGRGPRGGRPRARPRKKERKARAKLGSTLGLLYAAVNLFGEAIDLLEVMAEAAGYKDLRPIEERIYGPDVEGMIDWLGNHDIDWDRFLDGRNYNELEDLMFGVMGSTSNQLAQEGGWLTGVLTGPSL